ncbi:hypothetical protein GCM10023096_17960 [Nonomuraea ferruginea]
MSKYPPDTEHRRPSDVAAVAGLIAILLAGGALITLVGLSPSELVTVATALGGLCMAWNTRAR